MTNSENIRNMNDDELSKFLLDIGAYSGPCEICSYRYNIKCKEYDFDFTSCYERIREWLKEEKQKND